MARHELLARIAERTVGLIVDQVSDVLTISDTAVIRQSASARFDQDAMPMTVLIDRRGTVRWIHRGYNTGDEQEYDAEINALLRE